ncbi:nibrin [Cydia pomonella]|uniref:nibrin n=1 Tax=Cydia pomonella TaxID=82600 RepID=UPI002ADE299E|nr:nibrin [Cydia pomonella]
MWCLISQIDSRVIYIVEGNNLTVGRTLDSQCGIFAVIEDASISRKHACLSIMQNSLYLQDLGSRYGTFVNQTSERLEVTSKVQLKHNDVVRFGKLNSAWTVQEIKHVTCTSTLKGENLQNLRIVLGKIGASLKSDWDDTCTYLTMPAITLTIKVVLALAQGSYIVTPRFWNDVLHAVTSSRPLPNPNNFTPQVIESTINKEDVMFFPDERRSKLFTGKKFIFFSRRQLEMYKPVLLKSSALPLLLSESKMTKSMLVSPDVVVIQYNIGNTSQESQAQRNQINDIINYLNSKGKRAVADAEIGLAILYCSIDKYCNPEFSFTSEVFKQPTTSNNKKMEILAQDTQETQKLQCKKENVMINESLTPKHNSFNTSTVVNTDNVSAKRKLTEDISDNIMNLTKKVATTPTHPSPSADGAKRKLTDEEAQGNQNKKMAIDTSESNDDAFNFINLAADSEKSTKATEKKLNFFKPARKNLDTVENDDDLFNFVQDTTKNSDSKQLSIKKMFETRTLSSKETPQEISSTAAQNTVALKKEESDDEDLHSRMSDLDLGSTIVKIRRDLIVKKELLKIEDQTDQGKNFKKFKKVWPVKMQVTIIPKSSMSIIKPEGFDVNEISSLTTSDTE